MKYCIRKNFMSKKYIHNEKFWVQKVEIPKLISSMSNIKTSREGVKCLRSKHLVEVYVYEIISRITLYSTLWRDICGHGIQQKFGKLIYEIVNIDN